MSKKKTVLVLSAGGPAGISCIKALRKLPNYKIIAADKSEYAWGLQFADVSFVIPSAQSPGFLEAVEDIITKYNVDILVPSFETGHKILTDVMKRFGLDNESSIVCQDKIAFFRACKKVGLAHPKTEILTKGYQSNTFPKYIKPRVGASTINHFTIHSQKKLNALMRNIDLSQDYLIQDFLTGDHWNVDVHIEDGKFITAVPRRDIFQNAGQCISVEVRDYPKLIKFSKEVAKKLNIRSPFNLEVFETSKGKFILNEINVRFGGGIVFSAMSGVDMVSYYVTKNKKYLGKIKNAFYSRYLEEVPINKEKIKQIYSN